MKNIQFIHYFCRINNKLFTPTEMDKNWQSIGAFYIPYQTNVFPSYKFHYKIYQDKGNWNKELHEGYAFKNKNDLILATMEIGILGTFKFDTSYSYRYGGVFSHPDFNIPFYSLEPCNQELLEDHLNRTGFCMIGCDYSNMIAPEPVEETPF